MQPPSVLILRQSFAGLLRTLVKLLAYYGVCCDCAHLPLFGYDLVPVYKQKPLYSRSLPRTQVCETLAVMRPACVPVKAALCCPGMHVDAAYAGVAAILPEQRAGAGRLGAGTLL